MSNFSWQTDEETGWDDPLPQSKPTPPRKLPWRWLLIFLAAAALIAVIVYTRIQQQIETATAQAKQDVLATHQVSQNAAATGDLDLFRTNLSRRNPEWADTQRELVTEGLFLDRSAFGLRWWGETEIQLTDAAATPTLPITITLSPDFLAAELIYEQEYLLTEGTNISQTVRLQQTAIYRRGGGRWLRADPLDEFWGELKATNRPYLTVQFNARDQVMATRLANDLNAQLATLCQTMAEDLCDEDFRIRLLFTRNPNRFFTMSDLEETITLDEEERLRLPSPTLVGTPLDEAGYEAILRGYARPLLALAIARLTNYECCEHGMVFRAFLEKALSRLDIQSWPLTSEAYNQLEIAALPDPALRLWRFDSLESRLTEDRLFLYAFVDFLTESYAPEVAVLQWQAALANLPDYWEWLQSLAGPVEDQRVFQTQWMGFIKQQIQDQLLPLELPAGKVQLSCITNTGQTTLYEYRPQLNEWQAAAYSANLLEPVRDGYVYEDLVNRGRTLFFVQGDKTAIITTTTTTTNSLGTSFSLSYPFLQILNGHLPQNQFHFVSYRPNNNGAVQNWLVNLDECTNGVCNPRPVSGIPVWSPDEQHILFYNELFSGDKITNIQLADSNGQVIGAVGFGQYPIWLDNSHYAYFSYNLEDIQQEILTADLYIGHINGESPQPAFTYADLQNLIPTISDEQRYLMFFGQARPGDHQEISILVFPWNEFTGEPHVYVITLQWDEGWQELTTSYIAWDGLSVVIPTYSPDGEFELFINVDDVDSGIILTIRNLTTGEEQVVLDLSEESFFSSFPVWTEDSRWLMYANSNELLFVAPQEGYEWRVPHAFSQCNQTYYRPE